MCDINICRICLKHGVKGEKLTKNLKRNYEEVTRTIIGVRDELPKWLCFECASLLRKYHKFRDKCSNGQKVLERMLLNGQITFKTVDLIDRNKEKLNSTLSYPITSSYIKTFTAKHSKHRTNYESSKTQEKSYASNLDPEDDVIEPEECEIDEMKIEMYEHPDVETIFAMEQHTIETIAPIEMEYDIDLNKTKINMANDIDPEPNTIDLTKNNQTNNINDIAIHRYDINNRADDDCFGNAISGDEDIIFSDKTNKPESEENKKCKTAMGEENKSAYSINIRTDDDDDFFGNAISSDEDSIFLDQIKKTLSEENKNIKTVNNKINKPVNKKVKETVRKENKNALILQERVLKKKKGRPRKYAPGSMAVIETDSGLQKSEPEKFKFTKPKKQHLVPEFWEQIKLSEEEAKEEFKKKEFSSKYVKAKFKCEKCLKGFSTGEILARHVKLLHDQSRGQIECRLCHIRFHQKGLVAKHMRQHYTIFNCLRCKMKFNTLTSASLHDEYHNGVVKECKFCGKTFHHQSTYYTHIRIAHRSEHLCDICGDSFVSENGLGKHKMIKHVDVGSVPVEDVPTKPRHNLHCKKCDVTFQTRAAYSSHLVNSMMHDISGKQRIKRLPRRNREQNGPGNKYNEKPTTCKICGQHFSKLTDCMKHHVKEHRGMPRDPNDRRVCEICGASLSAASIATHMNQHTRAVLFPCDACGMQFTTKGTRDRHQVTHTGEKPYACSLCDKRYTHNAGLWLHHRTAHLKLPHRPRNRKKKTEELSD